MSILNKMYQHVLCLCRPSLCHPCCPVFWVCFRVGVVAAVAFGDALVFPEAALCLASVFSFAFGFAFGFPFAVLLAVVGGYFLLWRIVLSIVSLSCRKCSPHRRRSSTTVRTSLENSVVLSHCPAMREAWANSWASTSLDALNSTWLAFRSDILGPLFQDGLQDVRCDIVPVSVDPPFPIAAVFRESRKQLFAIVARPAAVVLCT